MEKVEPSHNADENVSGKALVENSMAVPQKVKHSISIRIAITVTGLVGSVVVYYKVKHILTIEPMKRCSVQFSSVTHSCPTLCDPMNSSTPGLLVHHQLPEFT